MLLLHTHSLIVTELVTNAIRHAQPPLHLRLIRCDSRLICEVTDGRTTTPHLRRARALDEGGRGLLRYPSRATCTLGAGVPDGTDP